MTSGTKTLDETAEKHAIIVYSEQTKLMANSFARGSTVLVSVGVIAPIANDAYVGTKVPLDFQIAWFVIWLTLAIAVHGLARYLLGKMKHV